MSISVFMSFVELAGINIFLQLPQLAKNPPRTRNQLHVQILKATVRNNHPLPPLPPPFHSISCKILDRWMQQGGGSAMRRIERSGRLKITKRVGGRGSIPGICCFRMGQNYQVQFSIFAITMFIPPRKMCSI